MTQRRPPADPDTRRGYAARAGDLVGSIGGVSFRKFGFVQSAIIERWAEIVGDEAARRTRPESLRFPAGRTSGGTLHLLVASAHAPLLQHMAPMIVERVNRFFGHAAVARVAWKHGRLGGKPPIARPVPVAVPEELGEGLRTVADPGLRASLEALAAQLAAQPGLSVRGKIS